MSALSPVWKAHDKEKCGGGDICFLHTAKDSHQLTRERWMHTQFLLPATTVFFFFVTNRTIVWADGFSNGTV